MTRLKDHYQHQLQEANENGTPMGMCESYEGWLKRLGLSEADDDAGKYGDEEPEWGDDTSVLIKSQLAADTVNGVYVCENPTNSEILDDKMFVDCLGDLSDGETIYGLVDPSTAAIIEEIYGIH